MLGHSVIPGLFQGSEYYVTQIRQAIRFRHGCEGWLFWVFPHLFPSVISVPCVPSLGDAQDPIESDIWGCHSYA